MVTSWSSSISLLVSHCPMNPHPPVMKNLVMKSARPASMRDKRVVDSIASVSPVRAAHRTIRSQRALNGNIYQNSRDPGDRREKMTGRFEPFDQPEAGKGP